MNRFRNIYNLSLLLLAVSLSCGTPGIGKKADLDGRLGAERWFNPLSHPRDTVLVTGQNPHRGIESDPAKPSKLFSDTAFTAAPDSIKENGETFSVQIYASKSLDDAKEYTSVIGNLFPEGVFIEYHVPYYKVRLGEFYSPRSGQAFLDRVKQMGFENAWLVRVKK